MKAVVAQFPIPQVIFVRSLIAISVGLVLARAFAVHPFRLARPGLATLRAAVNLVSWFLMFWALRTEPLGRSLALAFSAPLFVVLLSYPVLGERVGVLRAGAVLAGFAGIALLLAAIGIYGVTAHAVGQRTQEVGIRMAMGAKRPDVLAMLLVQHLRPALVGLAIGIGGAFALSRFLRSLLFGVSATDPVTFALTAATLLLVAALACFVPAARATRIDPLAALRNE